MHAGGAVPSAGMDVTGARAQVVAALDDQHSALRLGISACLLGHEVRFDAQHKRDGFLVETVGPFVTWVPVCPEDESGLGTPRDAMHLRGDVGAPRLVTIRSGRDVTGTLLDWAGAALDELAALDLDGFVVKKGSPSCGLLRVKVRADADAMPRSDGQGIFAAALARRFPTMPIEEEGRLNDPGLRESFFARAFTLRRWRDEVTADLRPGALVDFHSRHKYVLLAHEPEAYKDLGRLVAGAGKGDIAELAAEYEAGLMAALARPAERARHVNVLQHLMGFLPDRVDADDRRTLLEMIEDYRSGAVPLVVPVSVLRFLLRGDDVADWAKQQAYLNPYPRELMLRNHI